ncbi:hypothetical protein SAMN05421763_11427 [[Luteovulum] sphaeroides subsp. megalophilum]|nr:hypothetical protein SAMN05421763_11427 [[Luteovulum] sphaeroides subsp. megalophilum]
MCLVPVFADDLAQNDQNLIPETMAHVFLEFPIYPCQQPGSRKDNKSATSGRVKGKVLCPFGRPVMKPLQDQSSRNRHPAENVANEGRAVPFQASTMKQDPAGTRDGKLAMPCKPGWNILPFPGEGDRPDHEVGQGGDTGAFGRLDRHGWDTVNVRVHGQHPVPVVASRGSCGMSGARSGKKAKSMRIYHPGPLTDPGRVAPAGRIQKRAKAASDDLRMTRRPHWIAAVCLPDSDARESYLPARR